MDDRWPYTFYTTPIEISDREAVIMRERLDAAYEEMARNLNTSMYADGPPLPKPTRVQRWRRRVTLLGTRMRDAWLVLTGRAEIGDG